MKRLVLFVHYNKFEVVEDYVYYYLKKLAEISDRIIFISNSKLPEHHFIKLEEIVEKVIVRKNLGYDFMAWRDGLRYVGYQNLGNYNELVIANDSCYSPLFSFDDIFAKSNLLNCDFWGITESSSFKEHLQSSFLVFKNQVIKSSIFKDFWESIEHEDSKIDIIKKYELGLQEQLEHKGFKPAALFKIKLSKVKIFKLKFKRLLVLVKRRFSRNLGYYNKKNYILKNNPKNLLFNFLNLNNFNVTVCCWEELIELGCPFIKVEVLRDNSYGLKNVKQWESIIKKYSDYDTSLIQIHLKQHDR